MGNSSLSDWVRSPRAAMLANLALVVAGSALALLDIVDHVTAAVIVGLGFAGVMVTLLGQQ